jgi:hypothetical protein
VAHRESHRPATRERGGPGRVPGILGEAPSGMAARSRGLSRRSALALVVAIAGLVVACGGAPPDLGFVEPAEPIDGGFGPWKVVQMEGSTLSPERIEALRVEVAPDGASAVAFFQGGNPNCYTISSLEVEHRDPEVPAVTVLYGLRLGRMGCTADLASLAIRFTLEPPLAH